MEDFPTYTSRLMHVLDNAGDYYRRRIQVPDPTPCSMKYSDEISSRARLVFIIAGIVSDTRRLQQADADENGFETLAEKLKEFEPETNPLLRHYTTEHRLLKATTAFLAGCVEQRRVPSCDEYVRGMM